MARTKTNGGSRAASGESPDAITLLKADHKAVQDLFKAYEELCSSDDADPTEKQDVASRICSELTIHAQIEEEIFYPALRDALDSQDLLDEATVEHATAKDLIAQLQDMDAGDPLYDAKVTVLGEYINHHVDEEQGEMFKQARKAKVDLDALGEELKARKTELMAELGLADEDEDEEDDDDEEDEDEAEEEEEEEEEEDQEAGDGGTTPPARRGSRTSRTPAGGSRSAGR